MDVAAPNEEDRRADSDGGEEEEDDEEEGEDDDPAESIAGQVRLQPSLFGNSRPPTIFFDYPEELKISREPSFFEVRNLQSRKLLYFCKWERNCVKNAFARAGFERTKEKSGDWTALWGNHPTTTEFSNLSRYQKVNHFSGSWAIGRKDRLARTLLTFRRRFGGEFNFHPEVYHFPGDRKLWEQKVKAERSIWILKPRASSCGRGIRLVHRDNIDTIPAGKKAVVQRYLASPHLINGHKYDLRLYVVVTSVDPLRVYIYPQGLVRFSTNKYTLKNLKSRFTHLTNYTINAKNPKFVEPGEDDAEATGQASKWSLSAYWKFMEGEIGLGAAEKLRESIEDLVVKTVIAGETEMATSTARLNRTRCVTYELFGFDVILDSDLRPWLLEVNISPSLMGSAPLDRQIKGTLLADIFHLVGFVPHDEAALRREGRVEAERLKGLSKDDGRGRKRQEEWRRGGAAAIDFKELRFFSPHDSTRP